MLTNNGSETVSVSTVLLSGQDVSAFAITGNDCTGADLASGQFCTLSLEATGGAISREQHAYVLIENTFKAFGVGQCGDGTALAGVRVYGLVFEMVDQRPMRDRVDVFESCPTSRATSHLA